MRRWLCLLIMLAGCASAPPVAPPPDATIATLTARVNDVNLPIAERQRCWQQRQKLRGTL
jgi:hypothetical protein